MYPLLSRLIPLTLPRVKAPIAPLQNRRSGEANPGIARCLKRGVWGAIGVLLSWCLGLSPVLAATPTGGTGTAVNWLPLDSGDNSEVTVPGFAQVLGPQDWHFPEDFGPHPQYQTEWWYYTGNLETPEHRPFGFQLTFFRQSLAPESPHRPDTSPWRTPQLYSAHFTVSDIADDRFYQFERFSRSAVGLAGSQGDPYGVWLQDWSVKTQGQQVYLQGRAQTVALNLVLSPTPPVLQGHQGFSPKGPEPGNASYYYSQVQQPTHGEVIIAGQRYPVQGLTWMDHEYSTSSLSPGTVGWDWFALQGDDGSATMLYNLRREDGTPEPRSAGTFVSCARQHAPCASRQANQQTQLQPTDWQLRVLETWTSPQSHTQYPTRWHLRIPRLSLDLDIAAQMENQELVTAAATYWEGAVRYEGTQGDRPVKGQGYVEMTGYATRLDRLLGSP